MLIGGDDISNDVITHGTCVSMLVYVCARFPFTLIGGNLRPQSTESQAKLEVELKSQRNSCNRPRYKYSDIF